MIRVIEFWENHWIHWVCCSYYCQYVLFAILYFVGQVSDCEMWGDKLRSCCCWGPSWRSWRHLWYLSPMQTIWRGNLADSRELQQILQLLLTPRWLLSSVQSSVCLWKLVYRRKRILCTPWGCFCLQSICRYQMSSILSKSSSIIHWCCTRTAGEITWVLQTPRLQVWKHHGNLQEYEWSLFDSRCLFITFTHALDCI